MPIPYCEVEPEFASFKARTGYCRNHRTTTIQNSSTSRVTWNLQGQDAWMACCGLSSLLNLWHRNTPKSKSSTKNAQEIAPHSDVQVTCRRSWRRSIGTQTASARSTMLAPLRGQTPLISPALTRRSQQHRNPIFQSRVGRLLDSQSVLLRIHVRMAPFTVTTPPAEMNRWRGTSLDTSPWSVMTCTGMVLGDQLLPIDRTIQQLVPLLARQITTPTPHNTQKPLIKHYNVSQIEARNNQSSKR
jgi:hypothetical protein